MNEINITKIAQQFQANVQALTVFSEEIGRLAAEHDATTANEAMFEILRQVGFDLEQVAEEPPQSIRFNVNLHLKSPLPDGDIGTRPQAAPLPIAPDTKVIEIDVEDERQLAAVQNILASQRNTPKQELLLRQSSLNILTSYFEALIASLIQAYYLQHPDALPENARVLSLRDLREIGSVENAERFLISKEVEGLLRESLDEQLDYFPKRMTVDLKLLQKYLMPLREIFQRRNLYVHNDGVVNRIYLNKVDRTYTDKENIKEGMRLIIDEAYLREAIKLVLLCGIILYQVCWRQWLQKDRQKADEDLIKHTNEMLTGEDWDQVVKLANFASEIKVSSDNCKRSIVINHAVALKELGNLKEMLQLLNKYDWSASALRFRTALYALKDDFQSLLEALPGALGANEITWQQIVDLPLYRSFRESEEYQRFLPVPLEPQDQSEQPGHSEEATETPTTGDPGGEAGQ